MSAGSEPAVGDHAVAERAVAERAMSKDPVFAPLQLARAHVVPRGAAIDPLPDAGAGGVDLAAAQRASASHGADPRVFAAAVTAGTGARGGADAEAVTAVVGLAAWCAGALALREDALARARGLASSAAGVDAVAATLGLERAHVKQFLDAQRRDRFWWPGRSANGGKVALIGGFTGLGGEWQSPPTRAVALEEDGAFAILTGARWWRLDADVWCTRLVPVEAPDPAWLRGGKPGPATLLARASWVKGIDVVLELPGPSYSAWLRVEGS